VPLGAEDLPYFVRIAAVARLLAASAQEDVPREAALGLAGQALEQLAEAREAEGCVARAAGRLLLLVLQDPAYNV